LYIRSKSCEMIDDAFSQLNDSSREMACKDQDLCQRIAAVLIEQATMWRELGYPDKAEASTHNAELWKVSPSEPQDSSPLPGNFPQNLDMRPVRTPLPKLRRDIRTTPHLVYYNRLIRKDLSASTRTSQLGETLDIDYSQGQTLSKDELAWLDALEEDSLEEGSLDKDHLQWLAVRMVLEFVNNEFNDSDALAEIVLLGPILDRGSFYKMLNCFVSRIEDNVLLDVDLLQGLVQLVQAAPQGYLTAEDVFKILRCCRVYTEGTLEQATESIYHLVLAVARVVRVLAYTSDENADGMLEYEQLDPFISSLKNSSDPYLIYQLSYTLQACQYLPDGETPLQFVMRHSKEVVDGSGDISGPLKVDVGKFLQGLEAIQARMKDMHSIVKFGYECGRLITDEEHGFFDRPKKGIAAGHRQLWFLAIQGAETLVREGRLADFEYLVGRAPCRSDPLFQWGICQLLGEIAVDAAWDQDTRQHAINFVADHYNNADWIPNESVKKWILTILRQIADIQDHSTKEQAYTLLNRLNNDGDTDMAGRYPLRSGLSWPEEYPLLSRVQAIPYVERKLQKLRHQRLGYNYWQGQQVYIPLQAKASLDAPDGDRLPLMEMFEAFLDSDREVLLILGDSGAGKSTFSHHLERQLMQDYKAGDPIPLLINLSDIENPKEELVAKGLEWHDFSESEIQELKPHREFIIICDGYDENQLTSNLYTANRINHPGQWNVKLVITCRSEALDEDYLYRFLPDERGSYGRTGRDLFQGAVILPFTKNQIESYIEQYVSLEPQSQEQGYMDILTSIPGLIDMVSNPFLLTLALDTLPQIAQDEQDGSRPQISRVELYDFFVENWLEVNMQKLLDSKLSKENREAAYELVDFGVVRKGIEYSKLLSTAIFEEQEQDGQSAVESTEFSDRPALKPHHFSSDPKVKILRDISPLRRTGRKYQFIHRSMLHYFYSCAVYDPLTTDNDSTPEEDSASIGTQQLDTNSLLFRRNIVTEPSVVHFLCERVQQSPDFKQQLLAIIKLSKTDIKASKAAANAITILFHSGFSFQGFDLQGVRIPGADLSGGNLDSVQFQGADLAGINFSRSWLRLADFSGANMEDVRFGERPFLVECKEATVCTYSNDGRAFAVGLSNGSISVYDTKTWTSFSLQGHTKAITSLDFSPTTHQLASASQDKTWRIWDLDTREPGPVYSGHKEAITSIVYSPNGLRLATGGNDKSIRLWCSQTLLQVFQMKEHTDGITSLAFSPNGNVLASGSKDKTIRLWNTDNGKCTFTSASLADGVSSVAFSPDGQELASGGFNGTVNLWTLPNTKPVAVLNGHSDRVSRVIYYPGGQLIVSAGWDKTVCIWNRSTRKQEHVLRGSSKIITCVAHAPTGHQIAACGNDMIVRLWEGYHIRTHNLDGNMFMNFPVSVARTSGISTVAFSPDGEMVASGGYDSTVRLYDAKAGTSLGLPLSAHSRAVTAVAFSSNDQHLASASWDHKIQLWDTEKREPAQVYHGHLASVTSLAFSSDGQQLVSGGADWTVRLWDMDSQKICGIFEGHTQSVRSVAFSPDGAQIASGSEDKTVRIWSTRTGMTEFVLNGHTDCVACVAFSPDGLQIASASKDKTICLWSASTGKPDTIPVLKTHCGGLQCVSYSPDGQWIASGSDDNTVLLWEVSTGSWLAVIEDFFGGVRSVFWNASAHGVYLVTGAEDSSIRAWRLVTRDEKPCFQLEWGTRFDHLVVSKACIQDATGLSPSVIKLLKQRGAIGDL
ncbi:hypothetical protein BGZ99_005021, partial [Dissophora globulifera]